MKAEWIKQPIPILDKIVTAGDYKSLPIDVDDPRNAEPLVNVEDYGIAAESYYARTDGNNEPYNRSIDGALHSLYCRQGVCQRLSNINQLLETEDLELFLWDAYRPIPCQQNIWSFFKQKMAIDNPHMTSDQHHSEVTHYVSDVDSFDIDNSNTWPVHATGAAIDLTIRRKSSGEHLDMGAYFDDMSPLSHSDFFERELVCGRISDQDPRLLNRRLLHAVMKVQGFINYPREFWHFDWGDQMYLQNLQHHTTDIPAAAWYGYIAPPVEH